MTLRGVADTVGPRAVAEHVEQPAVRVVPVPLAGHVAHVLQPADLLLDEHAVPDRFRRGAAQRARLRPVHGRVSAGPAAPVQPLQPQRRQSGGLPATDQHVVVVRVRPAAQVVQRAPRRVRPELPELARGDALVGGGRPRAAAAADDETALTLRAPTKTPLPVFISLPIHAMCERTIILTARSALTTFRFGRFTYTCMQYALVS